VPVATRGEGEQDSKPCGCGLDFVDGFHGASLQVAFSLKSALKQVQAY
jgi:hypothetical protein